MKKRSTEEKIIGFLREVKAGLLVKELCRRYGFSGAAQRLEHRENQLLAGSGKAVF